MLGSDLIVLLATTGILHSPSASACMEVEVGIPTICMDGGMTVEMVQRGAATTNYVEIARLRRAVGARVFGKDARSVRVTSRAGTDLTHSVESRIYVPPLPLEDVNPYPANFAVGTSCLSRIVAPLEAHCTRIAIAYPSKWYVPIPIDGRIATIPL